jgi:hypothetical protein
MGSKRKSRSRRRRRVAIDNADDAEYPSLEGRAAVEGGSAAEDLHVSVV